MTAEATSHPEAALARYAADASRGPKRAFDEAPSRYRTAFQRDRDRILHSTAFRRLALKTQVIMPDEGDHHRTRLTHTLEVAQIARSVARALRLDGDLTEALALAHDLGHSPFGHTGEDALNACVGHLCGFDHNVQSLRIVIDLEQRYFDFDGLNLTWETLEGLAKRNGPPTEIPALLRHYDERLSLALDLYPSGEAQVAAIADDIAYNAHDFEDGLRLGLIDLDEAREVPFLRDLERSIRERRPDADPLRMPFALARGLVDRFVSDVIAETMRRLAAADPRSADDLRRLGRPVVALSPPMMTASQDIKAFLFARFYRHPQVAAVRSRVYDVVVGLTQRLLDDPHLLPADWSAKADRCACDPAGVARVVTDYVAGMTDRYALAEHRRLCDQRPAQAAFPVPIRTVKP
ncbi:deoxyguanosinetriphosphate triphosphohydrolase [Lichenihabitans psoromatis]|uniref:deoxyguanosinetriphosphate triphosphohydrolase n=1 Tax=Lichenihabitans psoromatis TaxID=2528642 RepID=UPI001036893D|nr:deoxyguanosinetriphosphate triphosphohydrolase [Lichenihabitans psoromatis]